MNHRIESTTTKEGIESFGDLALGIEPSKYTADLAAPTELQTVRSDPEQVLESESKAVRLRKTENPLFHKGK